MVNRIYLRGVNCDGIDGSPTRTELSEGVRLPAGNRRLAQIALMSLRSIIHKLCQPFLEIFELESFVLTSMYKIPILYIQLRQYEYITKLLQKGVFLMPKNLVTQELIGKLHNGQMFPNFLELSTYLNVFNKKGKPLEGNSRKHFLEELNRYVEYEKQGKSFVIIKVRPEDEVLPPLPTRNMGKFSLHLQNQIAYYLLNECERSSWMEFFWTPAAALRACGMTNKNFYQYAEELGCEETFWSEIVGTSLENTAEDQIDVLRKNLVADAEAFQHCAKSEMVKYIESALKSMAKNKEIFFEDCLAVFINNDPKEYHIPSEDQKAIYLKMYTNVIQSFRMASGRVCQSEQDIFLSGQSREFYEELDEKFAEIFTYDMARPMYHIVIEPNSLKRSTARTEYKLQLQRYHEMNDAMCKNIPNLSSVRRGRSVMEENPEYYTDPSQPHFRFVNRPLSDEVLQIFVNGMIRVPVNCGLPYSGFRPCISKNR